MEQRDIAQKHAIVTRFMAWFYAFRIFITSWAKSQSEIFIEYQKFSLIELVFKLTGLIIGRAVFSFLI